jgi:acyl-CoA carboxylase epsilon subunit-like protein
MMSHDNTRSASASDDAADTAVDLRFVTRHVTESEGAAVTAVILAALEVAGTAEPVTELGRDPWVQSGRALRAPISVGPGNWRRSAR